jgi:hypothetical protein
MSSKSKDAVQNKKSAVESFEIASKVKKNLVNLVNPV